MLRRVIAAAAVFVLSAAPTFGKTIDVPSDYTTIQEAVTSASTGDSIVVSPGTYFEHEIWVLQGLTIMSTDPSNPSVVDSTIVDGNFEGTVFHLDNNPSSSLLGLTIRNGNGFPSRQTGGVGVYNGGLLSDCVIVDNIGYEGGGIYAHRGYGPVVMKRCEIRGNQAQAPFAYGGGVYFLGQGNEGLVTIEDCTFAFNQSQHGGGAYLYAAGPGRISFCRFIGNVASTGAGITLRGGSDLVLDHCIFSENTASAGGGVISSQYNELSSPNIEQCTVTENEGGALETRLSYARVRNCIFWGNGLQEIYSGEASVEYSNVTGGWPGVGNLDVDPMFRPGPYQDYNYILNSGSPCVDAGDPAVEDEISDWHPAWPARYPNGPRSDMGAYGGPENGAWVR